MYSAVQNPNCFIIDSGDLILKAQAKHSMISHVKAMNWGHSNGLPFLIRTKPKWFTQPNQVQRKLDFFTAMFLWATYWVISDPKTRSWTHIFLCDPFCIFGKYWAGKNPVNLLTIGPAH